MNSPEIKIAYVLERVLRSKPHLNLKRISAATNVPYTTLHGWTENREPRKIHQVMRVADYLKLDMKELIFDIKPEKKEIASQLPKNLIHEPFSGKFEVTFKKIH